MQGETRVKEATVQLSVDNVRQGGSLLKIYDLSFKPKAEIMTTQYPGEARASGDLDIEGHEVTFKYRKRDHIWMTTWTAIQTAEANGLLLPDISLAVTFAYRGSATRTIAFYGDSVMKLSEFSIPEKGYLGGSWDCFFAHMTTV